MRRGVEFGDEHGRCGMGVAPLGGTDRSGLRGPGHEALTSRKPSEGPAMLVVRVRPGQEVLQTLSAELGQRGVRNGSISSLIGAVGSAAISTMPADDAGKD